jgi:hypothetical protein
VQTAGIVEALDVLEEITSGLIAGGVKAMMDPLGFEGVEEALHGCVVPAVALAAHRRGEARPCQGGAIGFGGVLDAAVGVVD